MSKVMRSQGRAATSPTVCRSIIDNYEWHATTAGHEVVSSMPAMYTQRLHDVDEKIE